MNWETHTLPCGHVIDQRSRWCHACNHSVAKIRYGEPGICPYCDKPYPVDKYKLYVRKYNV